MKQVSRSVASSAGFLIGERLSLFALAIAAATIVFELVARTHRLDSTLAGAWCGDSSIVPGVLQVFGHCALCWGSGFVAGVSVLIAGETLLRLSSANAPGADS